MLTFLRQLWRFFFKPKHKWRPVPRRLIGKYQMDSATEQERLLMKLGVARSPKDARLLMAQYNTDLATDVIRQLPPPKPHSLRGRFVQLMRRWDRHFAGNPYASTRDDKNRIMVTYYYRLNDETENP